MISCFLLAQSDRAGQFTKGFRAGNMDRISLSSLLLLAAAGLVIALIFYAWERFARSANERGPLFSDRRLFQDLCRLHRLDRVSIRCLQRLIHGAKLAHAAEVFLRPDLFQPRTIAEHDRDLLQQLRRKLFSV